MTPQETTNVFEITKQGGSLTDGVGFSVQLRMASSPGEKDHIDVDFFLNGKTAWADSYVIGLIRRHGKEYFDRETDSGRNDVLGLFREVYELLDALNKQTRLAHHLTSNPCRTETLAELAAP